MEPKTLTADQAGERLDAFLARSLPDLTRSAAQRPVFSHREGQA